MNGSAARPLLFLDVDGPLLPFGGPPAHRAGGHPAYPAGHLPPGAGANPLLSRVNPALGPRLAALPCELVWATTWMNGANEYLAPLLGLPELPVLSWPESAADEERDMPAGLHWKTRPLVDRAAPPAVYPTPTPERTSRAADVPRPVGAPSQPGEPVGWRSSGSM
ncbi:hypothetical protein [Streptomyces sioyaensis]|uniref:hypothetical protein n=1 Tax=Streptomyces sioyaensis TaxID=67364 RepID=UPI0037A788F1